MKKILSIVLALALVLSMSVVAFADETLFEHEIPFPEDNGGKKILTLRATLTLLPLLRLRVQSS